MNMPDDSKELREFLHAGLVSDSTEPSSTAPLWRIREAASGIPQTTLQGNACPLEHFRRMVFGTRRPAGDHFQQEGLANFLERARHKYFRPLDHLDQLVDTAVVVKAAICNI